MTSDIERFIAGYLMQRGVAIPDAHAMSFDLFASGAIDSLGAMQFVSALEDHFDIALTDKDILSESFRTIGGLITLVSAARERKTAA